MHQKDDEFMVELIVAYDHGGAQGLHSEDLTWPFSTTCPRTACRGLDRLLEDLAACFYLLKGCTEDPPACLCLPKDCLEDLAACFCLCKSYVEDLDAYYYLSMSYRKDMVAGMNYNMLGLSAVENIVYLPLAIFCLQPEDADNCYIAYLSLAIFCLQPEDAEHFVNLPLAIFCL